MPSVLTSRLTLSSEPSVLRTVLRMLRPTARAHSLPCSVVRSAPTRPVVGVLSLTFAGPWPDTYNRPPASTAGLYFAIGLGGGGRVRPSSWRRASGLLVMGSSPEAGDGGSDFLVIRLPDRGSRSRRPGRPPVSPM